LLSSPTPPVSQQGIILVPMRILFEALGAEVGWSAETQTIIAKKGSTTMILGIGQNTAFIDTQTKSLLLAPQLINGTAYIPLRFISESLGAAVEWDSDKQAVFIQSAKTPPIPSIAQPPKSALPKELSIQQIGQLENTIAFIENEMVDGDQSFGSGFFISSDGQLVTNYHVIANAKKLSISLGKDKIYTDISIIGYDVMNDLATLKINSQDSFPFCKLGDSNSVQLGDSIVVMGNPMGLRNTLSTGIISSLKQKGLIQITAPISVGSSGSPLFNMYGEVIGVASTAILQGENLGFCIPINAVKTLPITPPMTLTELNQTVYQPDAPKNVVAFPLSPSEIALQWDYNQAVDYYYVYFSDSPTGKFLPFLDSQNRKLQFFWEDDYSMSNYNLSAETRRYYKVTAVKNSKESSFSPVVTAVTLSEPSEELIAIIKKSVFIDFPSQKIGQAFDLFFETPNWSYFRSDQEEDVVEFTGTYLHNGKKTPLLLQFVVDAYTSSFQVVYMEKNGLEVSLDEFDRLLVNVFN
ncbi:MAG: copper amine oxidase, partial [Clostridia bacterium]|nr:copper amine oxidase [Clostridia bacterium]